MKPRLIAHVDGIQLNVSQMNLTKSGYRDPSTCIFTVANTDCKLNKIFNDYAPVSVQMYYKDEMLKGLGNWQQVFDGLADVTNPMISIDKSTMVFECRSRLSLLQDDPITRKWEKVYLHTLIEDLVGKQFEIEFRIPNFYIGDHLMEEKSRLEEINNFAELFGCITCLLPGNKFYFGEYNKGKQWIYQFLNNYPRTKDLRNANINDHLSIRHMKAMFPQNKVIVERRNEDKSIYKGVAVSAIPRITGTKKPHTVDHKYLTSNDMAQKLAEFILWKLERQYITLELQTYGLPFLEPEWVIDLAGYEGYEGLYWIKQVTTTYDGSSFTSNITAHTRNPKERFNATV